MGFRENGIYKFNDAIESHYKIVHKEKITILIKLKDNAEEELKELKEKYPELKFGGFFDIDIKQLLNK